MKDELRERILQYNKQKAAQKEKAEDLERIVSAFSSVYGGALFGMLPEAVRDILRKHGAAEEV